MCGSLIFLLLFFCVPEYRLHLFIWTTIDSLITTTLSSIILMTWWNCYKVLWWFYYVDKVNTLFVWFCLLGLFLAFICADNTGSLVNSLFGVKILFLFLLFFLLNHLWVVVSLIYHLLAFYHHLILHHLEHETIYYSGAIQEIIFKFVLVCFFIFFFRVKSLHIII